MVFSCAGVIAAMLRGGAGVLAGADRVGMQTAEAAA